MLTSKVTDVISKTFLDAARERLTKAFPRARLDLHIHCIFDPIFSRQYKVKLTERRYGLIASMVISEELIQYGKTDVVGEMAEEMARYMEQEFNEKADADMTMSMVMPDGSTMLPMEHEQYTTATASDGVRVDPAERKRAQAAVDAANEKLRRQKADAASKVAAKELAQLEDTTYGMF